MKSIDGKNETLGIMRVGFDFVEHKSITSVSRSEEEMDELVGEDGGGSSSVAGSSIVECSCKGVFGMTIMVTTTQLNTKLSLWFVKWLLFVSTTKESWFQQIYPNNRFKLLKLVQFFFSTSLRVI